jgi:23S rRNA (adenine2503-C2)-methyltransferase
VIQGLTHHDRSSLAAWLAESGFSPSHARMLLRTFYECDGQTDFSSTACPKKLLPLLIDAGRLGSSILRTHASSDGTTKILIGFEGSAVESVLMPSHRPEIAAGCVSSQIGCAMGCDFCASTKNGLERNLNASEIVEQFIHLKRLARQQSRRLKTLVFMGMGEPLLNLDNVLPAICRIADPDMGGLGWRNITVSTVGIVPGIERLADADLNVHLALSLHAPDDETRGRLIPSNRRYPIAEIMSAARRFQTRTGRVVNIEYCMLAGVNDSDEQAWMLADLMKDFRAHVNLIPYNSIGEGISGKIYQRPTADRIYHFLEILRSRNVVTHIRKTRGEDVAAACGQLLVRAHNSPLTQRMSGLL